MPSERPLPRPFARAYAVGLLRSHDAPEQVSCSSLQLSLLSQVFEGLSESSRSQLKGMTPLQTVAWFDTLLDTTLEPCIRAFLRLLSARNHTALLPAIHLAFEQLRKEQAAQKQLQIRSAQRLGSAELSRLHSILEAHLGKALKPPQVTIDPTLLAGIRVQVEDQVIDASLRGRFEQLRRALNLTAKQG